MKCIVEDCGYSSVWDEFRLQLENVFGLPAFPLLDAVYNACTGAEKEKLVVHDTAHGIAAATDPELYWETVTAFVKNTSLSKQRSAPA